MSVAVIIPARNEAAALEHVLREIPRSHVQEVFVVDNGSTDATADVARQGGARVVSEPVAGYGRACLAGLAALDDTTDVVVFMDGDRSDYPEDLPLLLAPISEGRADLVIGSRTAHAQRGSLTPQQRFGNWLACRLLRWLYGVRYTDLGPFRAIRRDALRRLQMRDQAFGWTVEMQAKAAQVGLRAVEVPVRYRPRIGRSKISGTLSGTVRAGWGILSTIARVALASRRNRRLLVFLKEPVPGQVKTRLAADLGADAACEVYRACVELTLQRLASYCKETLLYLDQPSRRPNAPAWLSNRWAVRPQQGCDLGERLAEATQTAFARGVQRVVVIGTDSPWLQPSDIEQAFAALAEADVVVGPADDGGYYLIGLARPLPALFEDISWSTPQVCAQTLARAGTLGLRVTVLPQRYDLDVRSDVERFLAEERSRGSTSASVRAIGQIMSQGRVACRS